MTQPTNEQKSRVIHDFIGCNHIYTKQDGRWKCKKCDKWDRLVEVIPNYFARDLPDHIRVEMVTAANGEFGGNVVANKVKDFQGWAYYELETPASVIAEAIYTLIQEKNDGNN